MGNKTKKNKNKNKTDEFFKELTTTIKIENPIFVGNCINDFGFTSAEVTLEKINKMIKDEKILKDINNYDKKNKFITSIVLTPQFKPISTDFV